MFNTETTEYCNMLNTETMHITETGSIPKRWLFLGEHRWYSQSSCSLIQQLIDARTTTATRTKQTDYEHFLSHLSSLPIMPLSLESSACHFLMFSQELTISDCIASGTRYGFWRSDIKIKITVTCIAVIDDVTGTCLSFWQCLTYMPIEFIVSEGDRYKCSLLG